MRFWLVFPFFLMLMVSPRWWEWTVQQQDGITTAEGGVGIPPHYAEGGVGIPPHYAEGGVGIPPH